ncbi:MAG: small, acid-soluble spore protein, alpha/beta type [Bacillota bacterium]|nr:small, acid-soluble spore protein, alpha/beta type [Bacillota bacterium]
MARRAGLMSDALKVELARELGVAGVVEREGWGSVSSRNCGSLVRLAIERAERSLAGQARGSPGEGLRGAQPFR